jgi:hypothetical protein
VTVRSTETFNIVEFLSIIIDVLFGFLCINEVPQNGRKFHSIFYGTFDALLNSFVLKRKVTYVKCNRRGGWGKLKQ